MSIYVGPSVCSSKNKQVCSCGSMQVWKCASVVVCKYVRPASMQFMAIDLVDKQIEQVIKDHLIIMCFLTSILEQAHWFYFVIPDTITVKYKRIR